MSSSGFSSLESTNGSPRRSQALGPHSFLARKLKISSVVFFARACLASWDTRTTLRTFSCGSASTDSLYRLSIQVWPCGHCSTIQHMRLSWWYISSRDQSESLSCSPNQSIQSMHIISRRSVAFGLRWRPMSRRKEIKFGVFFLLF